MKITGTFDGIPFQITKYNGINVKSSNDEVKRLLSSLTTEVFNPHTLSTYSASIRNSLLDAYLILKEKQQQGWEIELEEVPENLIKPKQSGVTH